MAATSDVEIRARRLALDNARTHGGTPRAGPIVARLLATDPELRARAGEVTESVERVIAEIAALSPEAQATELARLGGAEVAAARPVRAADDLPELPGAVRGAVVLRMAPFPSGALHIGNARMIVLNDYYRRKYDGKLLLVFDDTVGSEEKRVDAELFDVIRADLDRCGVPVDAVYYKSDRLPTHYAWAERVIALGATYVCVCPAARLQENRRAGLACPERTQSIEETQSMWQRMLSGGFAPGEAVLRLKTDLQGPDPAFRDRVLFRISDLDHPRVGHKWRVWPLLEFSWAVDDIELGVTHVLRGKDLVIEDRMQRHIWDLLGIRGPPFVHWGLLRVREAKISKSKSYAEVKGGLYDGWADPRTWSLASLDRRGISMESVRSFTMSFGLSLADIEVPAETLYAENRVRIDPIAKRRMYIDDPVDVVVDGFPADLVSVDLPNHPDRPELGTRAVPAGGRFYLPRADLVAHPGTTVRLKDLANIDLPAEIPASGSGPVHAVFAGRENRRVPRLQWAGHVGAAPVDVLDLEGRHRVGIAEAALRSARPGDLLQFERFGFVRVESDWAADTAPVRVCYGHP
ncbi:MAG TPA: glutamate--tRNA ligase [Thermoplasmata archaeon]|nr:glutamate--tRNA ligase [Thermoplasmata archaeon]